MRRAQILIVVEPDVVVRQPLAEYLRECGYKVIEAINTNEAVRILEQQDKPVEVVLADVNSPGEMSGFGLAQWIREKGLAADVILAGTVHTAAAKAADLCEQGPLLSKPYDHALLLDRIKNARAARERNRSPVDKS
jgi:DNA-binding response OmpR family regulator